MTLSAAQQADRDAITAALLRVRGTKLTRSDKGEEWYPTTCLFHDDRHRSASWQPDTGNFYCHAEAKSFPVPEVLKALGLEPAIRNGKTNGHATAPLLRPGGRRRARPLDEESAQPRRRTRKGDPTEPEQITTWEYRYPDGRLGHRKVRRDPGKHFSQEGPNDPPDAKHRPAETWPLYGDYGVVQGAVWIVVEGEKAVDRLNALELVHRGAVVRAVTCGAAGEFSAAADTLVERLQDLEAQAVLLWPDHDSPGQQAMDAVASAFRRWRVPFSRVDPGTLEGIRAHAGADDWVDAGGDLDALLGDYLGRRQALAPQVQDFFEDSGFVPASMGEMLAQEGSLRLGEDGRIFRYVAGVHRPDGEAWVRMRVRGLLQKRFKRRHVDEVVTWIKADLPSVGVQQPLQWLNLRNGLLDWRRQELKPHNPEVLSTIQLPLEWAPEAVCPHFDRFLQEVLPEGSVEMVWELIGYCLYPGNPLQRAVLLLGPGGNGKGVLLGVLRNLLGRHNVSALTLHTLAESRFAGADLYGRLANICGDLDARSVERSDLFKQITGGDSISAERKYGSNFTFVPYAKLIFAANEPPPTSDQSRAYFDRWLIIPMTRRIRGTSKEDPHLLQKLTAESELQGVLRRAVGALKRLLERGRFEEPAAVLEAQEAFHERLDSVASFLQEECGLVDYGWSSRPEVYRAYADWCADNGRQKLNSATFYERLLASAPGLEVSDHNGVRGFSGLVLHPE